VNLDAALLGQSTPLIRWDWIWDHRDDVLDRLLEHLELTVLSVGLGLAVSLVLALIALRLPRTYGVISGLSGILYTIPSLAAFAFLVPVFGFSTTTAVVPLASYTLLILVRSIVEGLRAVPAEVLESADGMGYTRGRRLWTVELPIAMPVIIGGLRVATVTVVGLVTVTALIGLGGLGFFILNGLRRSILFPTEVFLGTVAAIALAAVLDVLLLGVERLLTPWARRQARQVD
jgi:osmoprotectant transport system permease protein